MQFKPETSYSLPVSVKPPISILKRRQLRVEFPLPGPLLRVIGPNEEHDGCMWSDWLSEWGWTWSVTRERCLPQMPLFSLWLDRGGWPKGFDARVLSLAVALRLRVNGVVLAPDSPVNADLARVWSKISAIGKETLAEVLALATLQSNLDIFNFDSVAPSWPSDVSRVTTERRSLVDERRPAPVWLKTGYSLIGDGFKMLRAMGATYEDCDEIWRDITQLNFQPMANAMAYWSEAAHCLTERHSYEAAEVAQCKVEDLALELEKLTGLLAPLWRLQQGRIYYYAGNLELAFTEFLRQLKISESDLKVSAMLNREVANVLADMACLDGARKFAEISVSAARSQGQQSELYKSLGRLAEISIKLGDLNRADQMLDEAISIQEKLKEENLSPAQTLTYQGHLAVLNGQLEKAREIYDRAEARDSTGSSRPYIVMGRFSIAMHAREDIAMEQLWSAHMKTIEKWTAHQTHVLPAAVCTLAAARVVRLDKDHLPSVIRSLVANQYVVEAFFGLKQFDIATDQTLVEGIVLTLNRWQKSLSSINRSVKEVTGPLNGPQEMVAQIRKLTLDANHIKLPACYPMSLIQ